MAKKQTNHGYVFVPIVPSEKDQVSGNMNYQGLKQNQASD